MFRRDKPNSPFFSRWTGPPELARLWDPIDLVFYSCLIGTQRQRRFRTVRQNLATLPRLSFSNPHRFNGHHAPADLHVVFGQATICLTTSDFLTSSVQINASIFFNTRTLIAHALLPAPITCHGLLIF